MKEPKRTDIPFGEKYAVTRQALSLLWGKSDRAVRKIIEEFRNDPHAHDCIISHSDGKGYWRSVDIAEIEGFKAEVESRLRSLQVMSQMASKIIVQLRDNESQGELF